MATPDDLVHCPICLELYIQPRALPCLHTFCDTCLQEYIEAASRKASSAYGFECPICRRKTAPPSSTQNGHSGWSKLFPLNHIVVTLLDARDDSLKSENSGEEKSASTSTNYGSSINESTTSCSQTGQGTGESSTSSSQFYSQESTFHAQKGYYDTNDDNSYEAEDHDYWPPPPPHHPHPPPPGPQGRPPPHHFHPHGPPPHHGPPHHPHWPPPHHHRPHHRGRGCHGPNGGPTEGFHPRGPRGRFPHPHGPRHRHHHPPY